MKCGYSRRQSVLIVNVILERITRALRRGRAVKIGNGKLKPWDRMGDAPARLSRTGSSGEPDAKGQGASERGSRAPRYDPDLAEGVFSNLSIRCLGWISLYY